MSITVSAAPRGAGAPTDRVGSLAVTRARLLLRSTGPAITSIQAHLRAPRIAAAVPIDR